MKIANFLFLNYKRDRKFISNTIFQPISLSSLKPVDHAVKITDAAQKVI